jgi:hypothetical protein
MRMPVDETGQYQLIRQFQLASAQGTQLRISGDSLNNTVPEFNAMFRK